MSVVTSHLRCASAPKGCCNEKEKGNIICHGSAKERPDCQSALKFHTYQDHVVDFTKNTNNIYYHNVSKPFYGICSFTDNARTLSFGIQRPFYNQVHTLKQRFSTGEIGPVTGIKQFTAKRLGPNALKELFWRGFSVNFKM